MKTHLLVLAICAAVNAEPPSYKGQTVTIGDTVFPTWQAYVSTLENKRCGIEVTGEAMGGIAGGSGGPEDCHRNFHNADPIYDADNGFLMRVPCVFHVIRTDDGGIGDIPYHQLVRSVEILNEDFRAMPGTYGSNGVDTRIEFVLATTDPDGNATNGVNYYNNTDWFNDWGYSSIPTPYAETIGWDPVHYLNIYTNNAGGDGTLGYSSIPQYEDSPVPGSIHDRVVMRWDVVGENPPTGEPYHLGRTLTHEVGHYCGLWHVFQNWIGEDRCKDPCHVQGDTICDTNPQSWATGGCDNFDTCKLSANIENYMDYSDDSCMARFTALQANRMRCTLMHWRPDVWEFIFSSCSALCPPDLTLDNVVDGADLGMFIAAWGECGAGECCEDFDKNGVVDGADLGILMAAWGPCDTCSLDDWSPDCQGNCFPDWLIEKWLGDGIFCDDGTYIPHDEGCAECPPGVPLDLNCPTYEFDDGDCANP